MMLDGSLIPVRKTINSPKAKQPNKMASYFLPIEFENAAKL